MGTGQARRHKPPNEANSLSEPCRKAAICSFRLNPQLCKKQVIFKQPHVTTPLLMSHKTDIISSRMHSGGGGVARAEHLPRCVEKLCMQQDTMSQPLTTLFNSAVLLQSRRVEPSLDKVTHCSHTHAARRQRHSLCLLLQVESSENSSHSRSVTTTETLVPHNVEPSSRNDL